MCSICLQAFGVPPSGALVGTNIILNREIMSAPLALKIPVMAEVSATWRTDLPYGGHIWHLVYTMHATAEASAGPGTFTIKTFEIIYMWCMSKGSSRKNCSTSLRNIAACSAPVCAVIELPNAGGQLLLLACHRWMEFLAIIDSE
ncbi:hypothetical protein B0H13DRAFT_1917980 [Mycena leptocephala]|nr:hypothetical protein B0H13DRAFT_1917980 [Mycena leptocephala]